MGRIRTGDTPTARCTKNVGVKSRRRPCGLYSILGLSPSASAQTLARSYAKLKKESKPSGQTPQARAAHSKFLAEVDAAFAVLGSSSARKEYDIQNGWSTSSSRVAEFRARKDLEDPDYRARTSALQYAAEKGRDRKWRRKAARKAEQRRHVSSPVLAGASATYVDWQHDPKWQQGTLKALQERRSGAVDRVVARSLCLRRKDKRLGKFVVLPQELVKKR